MLSVPEVFEPSDPVSAGGVATARGVQCQRLVTGGGVEAAAGIVNERLGTAGRVEAAGIVEQ